MQKSIDKSSNWGKIRQFPYFQVFAGLIVCTFMGLMILVALTAYTRRSGQTGLDMGKVQKMRYELGLP